MATKNLELISVVIPSHNRVSFLKKAIETVLNQTWGNIEIIVVNDASTDATKYFLENISKKDKRIRYVNNSKSLGGAGSRNVGLALANGLYVAFLDDDDLWDKDKLEKQLNLLKQNKEASAVSCSFTEEYPSGKTKVRLVKPLSSVQEILKSNKLGGSSMCFALKSTFEKIGGFDSNLRSGQDWDLWIKLNQVGTVLVCDEALVKHIFHKGERITTNPKSVYLGRRSIFFKYKRFFSSLTLQHQLRDLVYLRFVTLSFTRKERLQGLFRVIKLTGLYYGFKCLRRILIIESSSCRGKGKDLS